MSSCDDRPRARTTSNGLPRGLTSDATGVCFLLTGEATRVAAGADSNILGQEIMVAKLNINGKQYDVAVPGDTPLLWVLRDEIGLTGTKFGCGMALCGACTIHIDGQPGRACVTPISSLAGKKVVTIEAIGADKIGKAVQAAWTEMGVPQCGYCQAGQIMSATALLKQKPKPTDADIEAAMNGNICRCGTYGRIRAAIKRAAGEKGGMA